jgi:glutamine amidotransferase
MLGEIRRRFPKPPKRSATLWRFIHELCVELSTYGVFNLLLSDSKHLYAYCSNKLSCITRQAPFGTAQLKDEDVAVDFQQETTPNDVVSVIATEPLTENEQWTPLLPGQLIVLKAGHSVFEAG